MDTNMAGQSLLPNITGQSNTGLTFMLRQEDLNQPSWQIQTSLIHEQNKGMKKTRTKNKKRLSNLIKDQM